MSLTHRIPFSSIVTKSTTVQLVTYAIVVLGFYVTQCHGQKYGQVEFHIKEQRPSGTEVGNIREAARIDQKVPPNELSSLIFKFLNPSNLRETASLFSINSDLGIVYTTAMIDRENVCRYESDCNVEFDVTVTSSSSNFFEIVAVRIVIEDINDNAPRFPNEEVTLFVQESVNVNKELSIVGATDKDKDSDNSVYSYEMKTEYRDVFHLKAEEKLDGTWDLKIIILKNIDRETKDHYVLYIIAKDNGIPQRSGNVTVHINVTDDNDNSPIFTENVYNIEVREQAKVNSVVGRVTATDADRGMNAAIMYRFSQARSSDIDKLFYVDSNSGEIKVKKPLQYDAGKSFETIVVASDRGNPPQASQAVLLLSIIDVGNTPPQININPVPNPEGNVLAIKENTSIDTVVAHVRTEDRDQGPNGIVDCRSISPYFKVLRFEGSGFLVEVAKTLDREDRAQLNVTIVCEDRGAPKLSVIGWFIIKLLDINDNSPIFTKQIYQANLTENNVQGDHVLYVRANDRDMGINKQLRYSISMKSAESSFMINERTGEITAGEIFDRETLSQVSFMVKVVDGGSPSKSGVASVVVNILDKNDQTPHFTSSMDFDISEKLPDRTVVGQLKGADRDEGKNGEFAFSIPTEEIMKQGNQIPFIVFPDGTIRTDRMLKKDEQERYKFPVMITDKGNPARSSKADVTIRVIDSNDHRPVFIFPLRNNNTIRVKAGTKVGSVIATLKATDDDSGRNAKLRYYINSNKHGSPFAISKRSRGAIILVRELSTVRQDNFQLNVSVHDQGIPVLKSNAVLVIHIDFENGMSIGRMDGSKNGTSVFGKTDMKYIIIAGVVGGLTIVISLIIVVIIILIRRPHRDHRRGTPAGVQEQGDGRHFDKQIWQSVPVDDVSPTREIREKKPSNIDMNGGDGDFNDSKHVNGDLPSKHSSDLIDPYGRKHNLDTFQVQQPQLYTFKKCGMRAPTDDFQSDTSGETTASDSGRGGSEEDIQLPPLPELCEDTSRIIFKSPGSGLKDTRFVHSSYPSSASGETISFQTFSPRTLPSQHADRTDNAQLSGRDFKTLGPSSLSSKGETLLLRHKLGANAPGVQSNTPGRSMPPRSNPGHYQGMSPTHPSSRPTSPAQRSLTQQQQQPQQRSLPRGLTGPGHYPDIQEKSENPYGKKVTFQTDLTTQNLKTWDLCQKMNIQPDAAALRGNSGFPGDGRGQRYGGRPRSQEEDDNTTTSGSYTINLDNDLDIDGLPPPFSTVS